MKRTNPYQLRNSWLKSAASFMALILFICGCSPIDAFASPSLLRLTNLWSSNDDSSESSSKTETNSIEQFINEERKIRASYFIQSSGFSPAKSTISLFLDGAGDKSTDSSAKQSMASLEQSQREVLLSRISNQDPEYQEYEQNLLDEWNKEWQFRKSASETARSKALLKQQQRLDAFLETIRQREEGADVTIPPVSSRRRDGHPGFGMPYGKAKSFPKQKELAEKEIVPKPVPETVADRSIEETPILGKIMKEMEEKKGVQDVATVVVSSQKEVDDTTVQGDIASEESKVSERTAITTEEESSTSDGDSTSTAENKNKPTDNLRLVQSSPDANKDDEQPIDAGDSEEAAKQRAAAAKAAQEKADRRVKERLDAANKEKEQAKAQAEAILNHSEEEERLHMEEQRKKEDAKLAAEKEAARLKAEQEEEERTRQQMEEEQAAMLKAEEEEKAAMQAEEEEEQARLQAEAFQQKIDHVESKMKSLTDKATGVTFEPKLDDGLYLVGVGVRRKAIINIYSVAMYASPAVLEAVSVFAKGNRKEAQVALRDAARTFYESSPTTSFVLEFVFKTDAKTIAGAIADSVRPRYNGDDAAVKQLEKLIFEGVRSKGGQATKGTIFRFDCSGDGVSVSVDGEEQGEVMCDTMGSAFVDVFLDDKCVSPKLVDSCIESWCESGL